VKQHSHKENDKKRKKSDKKVVKAKLTWKSDDNAPKVA